MEKNTGLTKVKGLQAFAHGAFFGNRDEIMEMPDVIAKELAAVGLVEVVTEGEPPVRKPKDEAPAEREIKADPAVGNKMAKPLSNK